MTRKITRTLAAILAGTQKDLYLGNLDARRDWGYYGSPISGYHYVKIDPRYFRPNEVDYLQGDPGKARRVWYIWEWDSRMKPSE